VNYLDIFRASRDEFSRYFAERLRSIMSKFYRVFDSQFSRYYVRRLTVYYLDILSGVSRWIISTIHRAPRGELSRFLSRVSLYIFSTYIYIFGVSRSVISIFCRTSYRQLSRYFVGRLTVKFLDILSGDSRSIISTLFSGVSRWISSILSWTTNRQLSRYFVWCLTWINSTFSRASQGNYSRHYVRCLTANYLDILSGVSR
jgi:hypothetical protein